MHLHGHMLHCSTSSIHELKVCYIFYTKNVHIDEYLSFFQRQREEYTFHSTHHSLGKLMYFWDLHQYYNILYKYTYIQTCINI
jgi:hypothetical protein